MVYGTYLATQQKTSKVPAQEKKKEKKNSSLTKLGKIRKVSKPPKMIA